MIALLFAQLIVVMTPDWQATQGTLQRYDKHFLRWRAVGAPIAVVIGRGGLVLQKREGDGKSPAGTFRLGTAFGFASSADTKLPYLPLRPTTECVDDSSSTFYNQIVERTPSADWKSSEKMRGISLYKWGVVVNYNSPPIPGAGSCIFLHVWRDPRSTTSGCTAMAEDDLLTLMRWLDPKQSPRLVQLPRDEYEQRRHDLSLP